jgi:hypothetical protein
LTDSSRGGGEQVAHADGATAFRSAFAAFNRILPVVRVVVATSRRTAKLSRFFGHF